MWKVNEKIALQKQAEYAASLKTRNEMRLGCDQAYELCLKIQLFTLNNRYGLTCHEVLNHGPLCMHASFCV